LFGIPRKVAVYGIWTAVALVIALMILLRRSRFGLAMTIVNDDPVAARGTGLNVFRMHVLVFVLSAGIASLAGVLRVHTFYNIGPSDFGLDQILGILTFVILGGMRSVWGPLVGTVVVTMISTQIDAFEDWELAVNGLLLLLIVVFLPRGLTSLRLPRRIFRRGRPPGAPPPAAEPAPSVEPEPTPQGVR
jgi:branched-chain amino acid transport system permease protein